MSTIAYRGASLLLTLSHALAPHRIVRRLRAVMARQESRHALSRMDERMLRDIGVTREQALRESAKPFWQR